MKYCAPPCEDARDRCALIADASDDDAPGAPPPEDGAERERWELRRRELYVGMTRARDGLWVAVV